MRRIWISVPLAAVAMVWVTATALAGGWAVTTLDSVPPGIQAGQTYHIGYLIRQHGVAPLTNATPKIIVNLNGERLSFSGTAEGAPGHYVSDVTFPSAGEWLWEVDQSPFPMSQTLGSITVAAVPSSAVAEAPAANIVESALSGAPVLAQAPAASGVEAAVELAPVLTEATVARTGEAVLEVAPVVAAKAQPPAELALLSIVALAAAGIALALRQVKRVATPAATTATAQMASMLTHARRSTMTPSRS